MKYIWALVLVLSVALASAAHFTIDAPTKASIGTVPVQIFLENNATIHGYEITITSTLDYAGHEYTNRTNSRINSLVILSNTTLRQATIAPAGIPNGTGAVLELNYTATNRGSYNITIDTKVYDQNGSLVTSNGTGATILVPTAVLRLNSIITNQRTANMTVCLENPAMINQLNFTIEYDNSTLFTNQTNFSFSNLTASTTCRTIKTITFNITAQPNTTTPVAMKNISYSPAANLSPLNGSITYNGYLLQCTDIIAYRNSTATIQLDVTNFTPLSRLNFTINSVLNLTQNSTNVSINSTNTTLEFQITNESNGNYTVNITDIVMKSGTEDIIHENLQCVIEIITNCHDNDGDSYYTGPECNQTLEDCDDTIYSVNPGIKEKCNNRDDDCDGEIDEGNVCKSSTRGGSGGGGSGGSGGESGSSAASASTGTASGGFSAFGGFDVPEVESYREPETKKEQKPIQTKLEAPKQEPKPAIQKKPEPKKVDLTAHLIGVLVLIAAGIFIAYEYIRHRHKH